MKNKTSWANLLSSVVATREVRPTGKGWGQFKEIQKEMGVGRRIAYRTISMAVKNGTCEVFSGKIYSGDKKRLCLAVWYRLKP